MYILTQTKMIFQCNEINTKENEIGRTAIFLKCELNLRFIPQNNYCSVSCNNIKFKKWTTFDLKRKIIAKLDLQFNSKCYSKIEGCLNEENNSEEYKTRKIN